MKKFIVFFLIVLGLSAEGADYNSMKDITFDVENAIGKTLSIDAQVRGIELMGDWNYKRRAALRVKQNGRKSGGWFYIFFNKRFKERIKKLKENQTINVTCRIKEIGTLIRCDLIDFTVIQD